MSISQADSADPLATTGKVLGYEEKSSSGDVRKLIRVIGWANIIIGGASFVGSSVFAALYAMSKLNPVSSDTSYTLDMFGSESIGMTCSVVGMIASLIMFIGGAAVARGVLAATAVLAAVAVVPIIRGVLNFISYRLQFPPTLGTENAYGIVEMMYRSIEGVLWIAPDAAIALINFAAFRVARQR